jgi:hypothetical protein
MKATLAVLGATLASFAMASYSHVSAMCYVCEGGACQYYTGGEHVGTCQMGFEEGEAKCYQWAPTGPQEPCGPLEDDEEILELADGSSVRGYSVSADAFVVTNCSGEAVDALYSEEAVRDRMEAAAQVVLM